MRLALALALIPILLPAVAPAQSYDCRPGNPFSFSVTFTDESCQIDGTEGRLSITEAGRECRVSTPQLRILTVAADGSYLWMDTDNDAEYRGTCAPRL